MFRKKKIFIVLKSFKIVNNFLSRESKEPKNPMIELFYGDYSEIGNNKGKYNGISMHKIIYRKHKHKFIDNFIHNFKDDCKVMLLKSEELFKMSTVKQKYNSQI